MVMVMGDENKPGTAFQMLAKNWLLTAFFLEVLNDVSCSYFMIASITVRVNGKGG